MSGHDHDDVDLLKWPAAVDPSWTVQALAPEPGHEFTLEVVHQGNRVGVIGVLLVLNSEFVAAYPSGLRDRLLVPQGEMPAEALQLASEFVMDADKACRRLVMAVDEGDIAGIGRAETAGYRFVVDVDIRRGSFALLTAEPAWVLEESRNIDEVPTD